MALMTNVFLVIGAAVLAILAAVGLPSLMHNSPSTMAAQPAETGFVGQTYPAGPGKETPLGPLAKNIFPHILNIYNGIPKAADFQVYAPKATFEDPLTKANGVPQIKSAFYSLAKLFKVAKMVEYEVHETEASPGNGEIKIDNKQHYNLMGREFDTISLITLQVVDGKVVSHEDWWNKKALSPYTRPIRRGNMFLVHLAMGFGADPKEAK